MIVTHAINLYAHWIRVIELGRVPEHSDVPVRKRHEFRGWRLPGAHVRRWVAVKASRNLPSGWAYTLERMGLDAETPPPTGVVTGVIRFGEPIRFGMYWTDNGTWRTMLTEDGSETDGLNHLCRDAGCPSGDIDDNQVTWHYAWPILGYVPLPNLPCDKGAFRFWALPPDVRDLVNAIVRSQPRLSCVEQPAESPYDLALPLAV